MAEPTLFTDVMTPVNPQDGFVALPLDDPRPPAAVPPVPDWDARIATIEGFARTAQEQATASRTDAQRMEERWAQERAAGMQQQERMTALIETLATRFAQSTPAPVLPAQTFGDIIEEVALNPGKKELANQYLANMIAQLRQEMTAPAPSAPGARATDAQRPLSVGEYEARTIARESTAQLKQQLVNDFATRHGDVLNDPEGRTALLQHYAALAQDPLTRALFPVDQEGIAQLELLGQKWDIRLLDRAANDVRQAALTRQDHRAEQGRAVQGAPTQGGGPTTGRPSTPATSAHLPRGILELLKDPAMAQAFTALTGKSDPLVHAKMVFDRSPLKNEWQQQAALLAPATRR